MASPFVTLPVTLRALLGGLDDDHWVDEARADCANCPTVAAHHAGIAHPFSTGPSTKCCTAQPNLANFLVGRGLAIPVTAAVIRGRIANRDGVTTWGICAVTGFDDKFKLQARAGFGRDVDLRCPYFVGGEFACGVWAARSALCHGFFCRHDRGLAGAQSWAQAARLAVALEAALAVHLVDTLGAPDDAVADDELLAWYVRCADAADTITAEAAAAIVARMPPAVAVDAAIATRLADSPRGRLVTKLRLHAPALADRLVPAVSAVQRDGADVLVAGYSTFDAVRAPGTIFALLSRLDGTTPWRDALAAARAETGEARLDDALVHELRRVGALRDPAGTDDPPEPST